MKDYEKFMLDNYNEELYIIREVIFDDKNICIKVGVDSETLVEDTAMGLLAGKYKKEHLEWLLEVM